MENNNQAPQQALVHNTAKAVDSDEFDLMEFVYVLLHHWKLILVAGLAGALVMTAYHILFVKSTYRATTQMYITNTDSVISLQDLQIGSQLTEDYKIIIKSRAVLNRVIQDLQLDTDFRGLGRLVEVSNPSGTHIINTSVTTSDIDLSKNIANDLLSVSIDRIYQVLGSNAPTIIDYSEVEAVVDVTPGLLKHMVIGGFVGAFIVVVFVLIKMLMDSTIKTDDDIEKYLKLPVLAAIPFYDE